MQFLKSFGQILKTRLFIIYSLFIFLWQNKMWWAIPMVLILLVFFIIIIFAQGSPLGPFIYVLF